MSRFYFEQREFGTKRKTKYTLELEHGQFCEIPGCKDLKTPYSGPGRQFCEYHQSCMREYGQFARSDRPWTFHRNPTCDKCGADPFEHPLVKQIDDPLVQRRVAFGMQIVDHIRARKDGGEDTKENTQTLCLECNAIKTTLAGDFMPKKLYNNKDDYDRVINYLKPHYNKVFGND